MADPQDFELLKTSEEPPIDVRPERPSWLWLVVAALVVATAAAAYMAAGRMQRATPVSTCSLTELREPRISLRSTRLTALAPQPQRALPLSR